MKKILAALTLVMSLACLYAADVQIKTGFEKMQVGESCIPGWINQYIKNPDNGVGFVLASDDGKAKYFNVKSPKADTSFYLDAMTPAKPGDLLICVARVKGKGKIALGCYGYSAPGRYFPLPGRQKIYNLTEKGHLIRAFITLSNKGRLPLGKIRPMFTVSKGSEATFVTLNYTLRPSEDLKK